MKQKICCKLLSLLLAVLMLGSCFVPAEAAQSTFQYDAAAAVAYARDNWNNGDGTVCDQFVKNCLHAGGVTFRAGGVDAVKDALVDAGFGTLTKLKVTQDGTGHITSADNPGVKAGDVLFFYCYGCAMSTHVVLIAGFDQNGNMQTYGHNPSWDLVDWMANFRHENDDGTWHDKFDFYAVKMDTSVKNHKHDFGIKVPTDLTSNLNYEKEHPHQFYDQCKTCKAKYYLGWNATTTNCYICNPSPAGVPVLTAEIIDKDGKPAVSLKWTAIKDVYSYEVLRAKGDSDTFYSLATVEAGYSTNSSGEPGVTYRYKVKAGNVESNVVTITWPGELAAPVLQGELTEDLAVKLTWTDNSNASGFEVYRKASNEKDFTKVFSLTGKSYSSSNVRGGLTYLYKVRAAYANGTYSDFSNEVSISVPSQAPVLTDATTDPEKPSLSWTGLRDAVEYEIHRRESGGTFQKINTIKAKTYTNSDVKSGMTYEYKVRAVYSDDSFSDFSNVVSITVPAQAPVLTDATTDPGKPSLSWTGLRDAVEYEIHRREAGGAFQKIYTIKAKSYTNSDVKPGVTYEYKVRAVYSDGRYSDFSNVVTIAVPGAEPAETLTLSANGLTNSGKPRLKWTKISDAVKYRVYRRMEGSVSWSTYTINSLTYTHVSANAGRTYEYQVCAVYANGEEGPRSNSVTVSVPGAEAATAPTLTANGLNSMGNPKLKWTRARNAVRYRVYRRMEGSSRWSTYTTNSLTYTHLSVAPGKTYSYQVCAVYANGKEGPRSNTVTIQVPGGGRPASLVLSVENRNGENPKLVWTEARDAVQYRVYRREEGAGAWSIYSTNPLPFAYVTATTEKCYEYQVCAVYANGKEDSWSNTVTVQCSDAEQMTEQVLSANGLNSAGKPKLKWTKVEGAVTYRVYRLKEGATNWTAFTINSLTYTHISAQADKTYEYKVCPIFADGKEGQFSNSVFIQAGSSK